MTSPIRSSNRSWPASYWAKVDTSAGPTGCWIWTGALGRDGYGLGYSRPLGPNMMAVHRIAYLLAHPDAPEPAMVLHSCDTPLCCNALHLFAGDQASNMADMKAKGRARGGRKGGVWLKVSAKQGHDMARMRAAGMSVRALGILFGLTPPGVRYRLKLVAEGRDVRVKNYKRGVDVKLVIDFGDDDCVWIEVTQEEHDQLEHHAKAFRESSVVGAMIREAESYSRIVAWAAQGNLLPADWNYRRKRADATRLNGVTHEFAFGLPVRVVGSASHKAGKNG